MIGRSKIRAFTALIVCVLTLLSGCAKDGSGLTRPDFEPVELWSGANHSRSISTPLNFLSLDGNHLMIEVRDVVVNEGRTDVEAIMEALINGPTDTRTMRGILSTSIELVKAEVSGKVANITLTSNFTYYREDEMLKVRAAIANTLAPVLGVDYINVYVDGKDPGYLGMPLGSTAPTTLDLALYCDRVIQEQNNIIDDDNYDESRVVTFYVPDDSSSYLVASPRTVQITPTLEGDTVARGYLTSVVQNIVTGAEWSEVIGSGYRLNSTPSTQTDDSGERYASIVLTEMPENEMLGLGALVCSVTGFVSNIAYVTVSVKDLQSPAGYRAIEYADGVGIIEDGKLYRSMFENIIADEIKLYLPYSDEMKLGAVRMYMPCDQSDDATALLAKLFEQDAFETRLSESDIIGVKLIDETAMVNLTSEAHEALRTMSERGAYLAVFSMVDTLTELKGIERVQFLFEGSTSSGFDSIVLSGPIMRNLGIISE